MKALKTLLRGAILAATVVLAAVLPMSASAATMDQQQSGPAPVAPALPSLAIPGFQGHLLQLGIYNPLNRLIAGPYNLAVTPIAELTLPVNALPGTGMVIVPVTMYITNNAIQLDFSSTAGFAPGPFATSTFNGYLFTTSQGTPVIRNVTIDPSTTLGLDDSRVAFNANQIIVNVQGLYYTSQTTAKLNVSF
jgi:hypothetical protein